MKDFTAVVIDQDGDVATVRELRRDLRGPKRLACQGCGKRQDRVDGDGLCAPCASERHAAYCDLERDGTPKVAPPRDAMDADNWEIFTDE